MTWLIDRDGANPNLHYVLDQAAELLTRLRRDARTVLVHCAAGRSRTPAVAAVYAARIGVPPHDALADAFSASRSAAGTGEIAAAARDLIGRPPAHRRQAPRQHR